MTPSPTPTDSAEKVVAEWRAAMEGVTPGEWTASEQKGVPRRCFLAQVFQGEDGRSLACIDATPDEAEASQLAAWIARCSPAGISGLLDHIERVERERDEARGYASLGCDAAAGGAHTVIKQGSYQFCGACGMTIKNHPLAERARAAEARVTALEAEKAELVRVVQLYCGHDKLTDRLKIGALQNHPYFALSRSTEVKNDER